MEENQVTQPEVTEKVVSQPEETKIKVKFNHEEKEIPLSEAQTLIQKGMNYDKVNERLQKITETIQPEEKVDPRAKRFQDYASFLEKYPDVKPESLPKEVLTDYMERNIPLDYAYEKYTASQKSSEMDEIKLNLENKTSNPGAISTNITQENEFYTMEELDQMSKDDIKKNYEKVMNSFKKLTQK